MDINPETGRERGTTYLHSINYPQSFVESHKPDLTGFKKELLYPGTYVWIKYIRKWV